MPRSRRPIEMEPTQPNSGLAATRYRVETDSIGEIEVEQSRLWGAQTERSRRNFAIGANRYRWGRTVIRSLGHVKLAAAIANRDAWVVSPALTELIVAAANEVISGLHDEHFPLVAFQTGSGTHTNMNANEVIANRANVLAGQAAGSYTPVHPNDHVNASQSSNDVFPTVMHLCVVLELHERLYPAVDATIAVLDDLAERHHDLIKVGRTHLQDATPLSLGQEIGAWSAQFRAARVALERTETELHQLAIGGTAIGTGLNAPHGFAQQVAHRLSTDLGHEFTVTDNHFAATASHDPVVSTSAGLRRLATAAMKMANDIRWLASGPRNGIGEFVIPENEPGSSIMPGKNNPTQAEALTMVAAHVFGNDTTIAFAGAQGNFQLNAYKTLILDRVLDSITLMSDALDSFREHCLVGLAPNQKQIAENLRINLARVTALAPTFGYELAAHIAKQAHADGTAVVEAAHKVLDPEGNPEHADIDTLLDPYDMAYPPQHR